MRYLLKYFVKRLPREGFKSLSVPFLALALVFLINVMCGVKAQMEEDYENTMNHHPIYIEVCDGDGVAVDGLRIGESYLNQFTDPDALWSLSDYLDDVQLKRRLDIIEEGEQGVFTFLLGLDDLSNIGLFGKWFTDRDNLQHSYALTTHFTLEYDENMRVDIFEKYGGFDAGILSKYQQSCVISEDLLGLVSEGGYIHIILSSTRGRVTMTYDYYLRVMGTVSGPANRVYSSLPTVGTLLQMANIQPGLQRRSSTLRYNFGKQGDTYAEKYYKLHFARVIPEVPETGSLIGVTTPEAYSAFIPGNGARIEYNDGYDETMFRGDEYVCAVSSDVLDWSEDGLLSLTARSNIGLRGTVAVELTIAGTVYGAGGPLVLIPFDVASELGVESSMQPPYTERMGARLADNNDLDAFKQTAMRTFHDAGVFFNEQTFSMTIYDAEFYNITEALMQTIFFVDAATPFVYVIAVSVGFIASYLLTRRRKAEFANMRSIGVSKAGIFFGALFEQTVLCAAGATLGCALFALTWEDIFIERTLIFLACYVLGAAFSAAGAAGTDVLKLLRDKG